MKKVGLLILAIFLFLAALAPACLPSTNKPGEPAAPVTQPEPAKPIMPTTQPAPAKPPAPPEQSEPAKPPLAKQLAILASSAEAVFPAQLDFSLKAQSSVNITDIRLHYNVERESFAQVTSEVFLDFVPGTTVDVQWPWDMRKTGGLPTGALVEYWWTVRDADGNKAETSPTKISFDDTRYAWQSLTEKGVTIYWYRGDNTFGGELMAAAQQGLVRLTETTGAYLKKRVKMYIYANSSDLQGAMIFPQEWTGGAAFTEFGIITIGIDTGNLVWGKRALVHELTHQVVHQMTFNPYIELPTWLEEGLAMYNEGTLEADFLGYLSRGVRNNNFISVRSLSSPFSAKAAESYLSYAQSYSLVEFLVTTYGQNKMLELLNTFSQGNSYDGALTKVYSFDTDGLNSLWRDYVTRRYRAAGGEIASVPPFLVRTPIELATSFILPLILASPGRAGRQNR